MDGFYEWKPDKSPVRFVRRRRELFCVAGLWKKVEKPGIDLPLAEKCFVLLTTAANPSVAPIHDPDAIHRSRRALRPRNKLGACLPKIELMLQEDMALPRKHAEMLSKFRMGSSAQFETECNETARCINSFKDTGQ